MKLSIAPVSQRDSRWSGQRLGTVNETTIGSHGCVITDMAMLSTYYNHPILPNQIDDILTDRGLYFDGNLFVNGAITKLFPDIKFERVVFCETTPAPLDEIKKYLDEGKPVVVALINQGIRHYILVVGYEGNKIFANDPWQGDQVAINDRWGDPGLKILQVNFFSGPVPKKTSPQPTPIPPAPTTPVVIPPTPPVDHSQVDFLNSLASLHAANQNLQNQLLLANSQMADLGSQIAALKASLNTHPNDGPHMDDGGVVVSPTPAPVDVSPIKDALDTGLANIKDILGELIKDPADPPAEKKNSSQIFLDSLKSRKFLLSILAATIAFLNSNLNLGLSVQQVLIVIAPLLTFVGIEGIADIVQRAKTPVIKN